MVFCILYIYIYIYIYIERERERKGQIGLVTESTRIKLELKFNAEIKGAASPAIYDMNFKRISEVCGIFKLAAAK